jgi:hypothetical protein
MISVGVGFISMFGAVVTVETEADQQNIDSNCINIPRPSL